MRQQTHCDSKPIATANPLRQQTHCDSKPIATANRLRQLVSICILFLLFSPLLSGQSIALMCEEIQIVLAVGDPDGIYYEEFISCPSLNNDDCELGCIETCLPMYSLDVNCIEADDVDHAIWFSIGYSPDPVSDITDASEYESWQYLGTVESELPINGIDNYFDEPGYYTLSVVVYNEDGNAPGPDLGINGDGIGVASSDTSLCIHTIVIDPLTPPNVSVSPAAPYCVGQTISFTLNELYNYDYVQWLIDGEEAIVCGETSGPISTTLDACEVLEFTPTTAGNYVITINTASQVGTDCEQHQTLNIPITLSDDICCTDPTSPCCTNPDSPCCADSTGYCCTNPNGSACCMAQTPAGYYLWFNAMGNVVPAGTAGATPDYNSPPGAFTWTLGVGNHPFGNAAGTAADPIRINGDINIGINTNIILENLHFEFGPNGRINVRNNGTLELRGAELIGDPHCKTMWQGIRIWGPGYLNTPNTGNAGQLIINQGNPITIRDAIVAIATAPLPLFDLNVIAGTVAALNEITNNFVNPGSLTIQSAIFNDPAALGFAFGNSGGILSISDNLSLPDTYIENCLYGLYELYQSTGTQISANKMHFRTVDGGLRYPFEGFDAEVGIGIVFSERFMAVRHCSFDQLSYGIRVNFGRVTLVDNTFQNCKRGVSVRNTFNGTGVGLDANITSCYFNHCTIGIQADGSVLSVSQNILLGDLGQTDIGIFLRGCDFNIGPNLIEVPTTSQGNTIADYDIGILVLDSDVNGNVISNNIIGDNLIGTWVAGTNNNLQITCNDFLSNLLFGLYLDSDSFLSPAPSTLPMQGVCDPVVPDNSRPAANLFVNSGQFDDIMRDPSQSQSFIYNEAPELLTGVTANDPNIIAACPSLPSTWTRDGQCSAFIGMKPLEELAQAQDPREKDYWADKLVRYYKEMGQPDSAINVLEGLQSQMAQRKLVEEYYLKSQDAIAENLLETMERSKPEDDDYYALFKLLIGLREEGRSIFQITPDEEAMLMDIAIHKTHTAYRVQALLYVARGYEFPVQLPDIGSVAGFYTAFKTNNSVNMPITIAPNPANNFITLQSNLPTLQTATIFLYNAEGKLLYEWPVSGNDHQEKDVSTLANGLYFCKIVSGNTAVSCQKLIISR